MGPSLPPQKDLTNYRRAVLGGIIWVARTGSLVPEEYGKRQTNYRRHESQVKQGLWRRIPHVVGEED